MTKQLCQQTLKKITKLFPHPSSLLHVCVCMCLYLCRKWCFYVFSLQVVIGDKVVLNPVNAGQPLHASSHQLVDNPGCNEVRLVCRKTLLAAQMILWAISCVESNYYWFIFSSQALCLLINYWVYEQHCRIVSLSSIFSSVRNQGEANKSTRDLFEQDWFCHCQKHLMWVFADYLVLKIYVLHIHIVINP